MLSTTNSAVNSGAYAPTDMSQVPDSAETGSRATRQHDRVRFRPRGKRAGVALRAKKETELASRESIGMKHVAKDARTGTTGMIDYARTDQTRLLELVEELTKLADAKTERELFPLKEPDIRTYTDDWSNVHLWNAAIAHYVHMSSKIPNLFKQFDIIEYLSYIQMVIELKLIRQRNVPFRHALKTPNIFDIPDAILMQSVLPAEIVNFMETLRPRFGTEGGVLYFMPYTYTYQYSLDDQSSTWTEPAEVTPEFVYMDCQIQSEDQGNGREGYHRVTRLDLMRSRVLDATMHDVGTRFRTKRLNIFNLIELRKRVIQENRREVHLDELNNAIGYSLFTQSFSLNINRQMSLVNGCCPRYGSLLHQETALYPVLTRVFNDIRLNYFTSFNVEVWKPMIRPITLERTDTDGKLKFLATVKPTDYVATPFVIKHSVDDAQGLQILDMLRHRGLISPSRWRPVYTCDIQTMQRYFEAHLQGQSMAPLIQEWYHSSALG